MAVVVLSGISSSCVLNLRIGSDVSCRKCISGVGTNMASSSSWAPLPVSEASTSFQNSSVLFSVREAASARSFCSQSGAVYRKERLSSRWCSVGQEFGETGISWNDERGARLKGSATKDSSRDVFLQTDPRDPHVSPERLITTRSGEPEEDRAIQRGELDEKETSHESLSEQGRLLSTDSDSSTSEKGVKPAIENDKQDDSLGNSATIGTVVAGLGLVLVLGGFGAVGFFYKDQLNEFLIQFTDYIEGYGPAGYGLFVLGYAGLELLAIPAIPLTMSAGLLFGAAAGTAVVSIAGTIAATGAFLIARYLARNRLLEFIKDNKKFLAIDKAIGDDGFRVVTLLRLSPLLPFSLGNYLYGLTSVKLGPYILGSWLGMLPGSWAYVSAGAIGRTFIIKQESESVFSGGPEQLWTLGLGIVATIFAASYVTRIAKEALKDIDD